MSTKLPPPHGRADDAQAASAERWVALVYHNVLPHASATGGGPERFSVSVRMFERVLDVIADHGLIGCSVATAIACHAPRVAITFDDAEAGVFEHALPALRRRNMSATIYVVTDWVGRPGYMTWDQLHAARDLGISIQSHTRSHPFLSELDADSLWDELARSRERLDQELRQETTEIAFPGGNPPRGSLRSMIWRAGYKVAVGTRWGFNGPLGSGTGDLRRCTVRGDISAERAERLVTGDRSLANRMMIREGVLRGLRDLLGASNYARLRRRFLGEASAHRRRDG